MKNFLLCMLAGMLLFSCSDKEELSKPITPEEEESTVEVVDSLFYSLDVDGFELVAATNSHTSLFFQTDTTFAFKCLFDSCGTNRLVAYCDSTGLVERIVADNQVINVLHHQDKKKLDIFFKDTNNKLSWIKDLKSPYKNLSSRAETGDVPYSAINIVNKLSYAVYTIINTSEVQKAIPSDMVYWKFIGKYQKLETYNMKGTVVFKLITQALGLKYQLSISNHFGTIVSVMSDYTNWVKKQLYGNALPVLRTYASFAGGYVTDYNDRDKDKDKDEKFWDTNMTLNAYIDGGDSLKNELRVGIMVAKEGDKLNAFNFLQNKSMEYSSQTINYPCSFTNLPSGQKYKFRPYLAPAFTSKYLTGLRGLLDYYQYNFSKDYRLLETKAQLKSKEDNQATIKLSVENADISIKMGIIYGEHSNLLQHDFKKIEFEPTFEGGLFTNNFEKEVKLEELESGYTYYMPYIIYNDNVLNHHIYATDTMVSDVITEKDYIFYGKKDSVEIINNPITGDAKLNEKTLTFNGSYDIEIKDVIEYGICYSKDNKEFKIDNSSVLKANAHQDGEFKVDINININEDDKNFYYRAFIKVKEKYYYGEIKNYTYTKDQLREALIKLYKSTDGDNWTHNHNWLSDKPISEWYGVWKTPEGFYDITLYDNNLKGSINSFSADSIITFTLSNNQINSIDIKQCSSLEILDCSYNQLTSLDISNCLSLNHLRCNGNKLVSLSINSSLKDLYCADNQIVSIENLSKCTSLTHISCGGNKLTTLDISNLNLETLFCDYNQINSLDISRSIKLKEFSCNNNKLTSLDISNCTELKELECGGNQLTSLNISKCTKLDILICADNRLTSLDVSKCIYLQKIYCNINQLNSLDVSMCTNLQILDCSNNQLNSLNISKCTKLDGLDCHDNQLIDIDIDSCRSLLRLMCYNNKITKVIPDWLASQISAAYFRYDQRFTWDWDGKGKDNGIGWYTEYEYNKYLKQENNIKR